MPICSTLKTFFQIECSFNLLIFHVACSLGNAMEWIMFYTGILSVVYKLQTVNVLRVHLVHQMAGQLIKCGCKCRPWMKKTWQCCCSKIKHKILKKMEAAQCSLYIFLKLRDGICISGRWASPRTPSFTFARDSGFSSKVYACLTFLYIGFIHK